MPAPKGDVAFHVEPAAAAQPSPIPEPGPWRTRTPTCCAPSRCLNLRNLIGKGLTRRDGSWVLAT